MRLGILLAVVPLLLAGCTGPSDAKDVGDLQLSDVGAYLESHYCVVNDVNGAVYAPDHHLANTPWKIGDSWTFKLDADGKSLGETKLVYYQDDDFDSKGIPQHYIVGSAKYEDAFEHALFSTNPVLGRIHRLLYSPHESGVHSDMFNFPLCNGNSWKTKFYGTDFTMTASKDSVTFAGTTDPNAFKVTGVANDGSKISYHYSPIAKWFTDLDYQGKDDSVKLQLVATGTGSTGDAYFLRAQKDFIADEVAFTGTELFSERAQSSTNYDKIGAYIELKKFDADRKIELNLIDPDGKVVGCVGKDGSALRGGTTTCSKQPLRIDTPFKEGKWTLQVRQSAGFAQDPVDFEFRMVSIADKSGKI